MHASNVLLLTQIKKATGAEREQMGKITDNLVQWQLAHPDATQQDAEEWLKTSKHFTPNSKFACV